MSFSIARLAMMASAKGTRDALGSQGCKVIANRDPECVRHGDELEGGKVGQQPLPMCRVAAAMKKLGLSHAADDHREGRQQQAQLCVFALRPVYYYRSIDQDHGRWSCACFKS